MALVDSGGFSDAVRTHVGAGRKVAVFSRQRAPRSPSVIELPAPSSALEYAHVMYRALRKLDEVAADILLVECVPQAPEWLAIRDRLARAARRDFGDDET
jgi:L-threonylcarbamoyladenylate synthase